MQKSIRFMATVLVLGAYLLSACAGAAPQSSNQGKSQGSAGSKDVAFTGAVEAISGNHWTVNGQTITVDGSTAVDANVSVGDMVKVKASVDSNGSVVASRIESSSAVRAGDNSNSGNDNANSNGNTNDNSNDSTANEQEVSGVVDSISDTSVSIDGAEYGITGDTQFKDAIVAGDQVKAQILTNADGTMVVTEIEKVDSVVVDDNTNDNSNDQVGNSNDNTNDDNSNDQVGNSNDNSNDDNSNDQVGNSNDNSNTNDNSNGNSNDDNGGNSNDGGGGNSNDDNGGGGNSNDNGG